MGKQLESRTIPPYEPKAGEEYMSPEQVRGGRHRRQGPDAPRAPAAGG